MRAFIGLWRVRHGTVCRGPDSSPVAGESLTGPGNGLRVERLLGWGPEHGPWSSNTDTAVEMDQDKTLTSCPGSTGAGYFLRAALEAYAVCTNLTSLTILGYYGAFPIGGFPSCWDHLTLVGSYSRHQSPKESLAFLSGERGLIVAKCAEYSIDDKL